MFSDPAQDERDRDWSPDGQSMVFGHIRFGPEGQIGQQDLRILDLRTRQTTTLPGSEGLFSPRWSPGGKSIAAMPTSQQKLVLYDLSNQTWSDVVTEMTVNYPCWSRDGEHIYFDGLDPREGRGYYRVRVRDKKLERVADFSRLDRAPSPFGLWSGLGPDDSPYFMREASIREIYALEWEAP